MVQIKTSVYLLPEIYAKAKKLAKTKKLSYSDWVNQAIMAAISNPHFTDPTSPTQPWEVLLQNVERETKEKALREEYQSDRLDSLEAKLDSIMAKFEVEQPSKDKSGRRIFDD